MSASIEWDIPEDPRGRILAIEELIRSMCEQYGWDPAEAIMMLLTAAMHIASVHGGRPARGMLEAGLLPIVRSAAKASDEFFPPKRVVQ